MTTMRRSSLGWIVGLGLLPFVVGASPGQPQAAAVPQVCLGIPPGARLIDGLRSGQAVSSGQLVTLRFSNVTFACGQWLTSISSEGCQEEWAFSLTLPADAIQPGQYNLSALSAQFGDLFDVTGPGHADGCTNVPCSMSVDGIGSIPITASGAVLEIYSANDECVTGSISGLSDPIQSGAPNYNGAFFALRCPS
jgi:hypothetical protein